MRVGRQLTCPYPSNWHNYSFNFGRRRQGKKYMCVQSGQNRRCKNLIKHGRVNPEFPYWSVDSITRVNYMFFRFYRMRIWYVGKRVLFRVLFDHNQSLFYVDPNCTGDRSSMRFMRTDHMIFQKFYLINRKFSMRTKPLFPML